MSNVVVFCDHTEHRKKHDKLNAIPVLSVSLNSDRNHYVSRMLKSIDHPIERIVIQFGNDDSNSVRDFVNEIQQLTSNATESRLRNVTISTIRSNPGSANGFNFGLRSMMETSAPWVLVINSDIAFYPGVLHRISKHADRATAKDDKFGLGFTDLCCGSEWSAVVFSRKLVETIGFFDENFYPAYYEDDDYAIRSHLANMHAVKFNNTALLHGEIDGSKDYLSGVFKELYLSPDKKSPATVRWRRMFEYGSKMSKEYIEKKWGISMDKKTKIECKSVLGINQLCRPGYKVPFNNPFHNISHWVLDESLREKIVNSAGK